MTLTLWNLGNVDLPRMNLKETMTRNYRLRQPVLLVKVRDRSVGEDFKHSVLTPGRVECSYDIGEGEVLLR